MAHQFNFVSTDSKVQACMNNARHERSQYVAELASHAVLRLRHPVVATLGAVALGFLVLASFAPSDLRSRTERASISPSDLTQQVGQLPTAEMVDAQ